MSFSFADRLTDRPVQLHFLLVCPVHLIDHAVLRDWLYPDSIGMVQKAAMLQPKQHILLI